MLTMQERVQAGIKYLDSDLSVGDWRELIDLEKLDMSSELDCIIGQVFGNFRDHFGIGFWGDITEDHESVALGFAYPDSKYNRELYLELEDEWRKVLSA